MNVSHGSYTRVFLVTYYKVFFFIVISHFVLFKFFLFFFQTKWYRFVALHSYTALSFNLFLQFHTPAGKQTVFCCYVCVRLWSILANFDSQEAEQKLKTDEKNTLSKMTQVDKTIGCLLLTAKEKEIIIGRENELKHLCYTRLNFHFRIFFFITLYDVILGFASQSLQFYPFI